MFGERVDASILAVASHMREKKPQTEFSWTRSALTEEYEQALLSVNTMHDDDDDELVEPEYDALHKLERLAARLASAL